MRSDFVDRISTTIGIQRKDMIEKDIPLVEAVLMRIRLLLQNAYSMKNARTTSRYFDIC